MWVSDRQIARESHVDERRRSDWTESAGAALELGSRVPGSVERQRGVLSR